MQINSQVFNWRYSDVFLFSSNKKTLCQAKLEINHQENDFYFFFSEKRGLILSKNQLKASIIHFYTIFTPKALDKFIKKALTCTIFQSNKSYTSFQSTNCLFKGAFCSFNFS